MIRSWKISFRPDTRNFEVLRSQQSNYAPSMQFSTAVISKEVRNLFPLPENALKFRLWTPKFAWIPVKNMREMTAGSETVEPFRFWRGITKPLFAAAENLSPHTDRCAR